MKDFLEDLFAKFHSRDYLASDPLEFVHRYGNPLDQEAVGMLSALLAYGNVKQIRRSVADLLARIERLEPAGPSAFIGKLRQRRELDRARKAFDGFVHRFNRGQDLLLLLRLLARSRERYGSLGVHFGQRYESGSRDFGDALSALIVEWRSWAGELAGDDLTPGFSYLLTSPGDGSCCKRWCMFLRWMGRKDALDPGLWSATGELVKGLPARKRLAASGLVIPLDTHTARISSYLGLTERRSVNWLTALEVTESLRACDPVDPVRYDFALSRLGILDVCQKAFRMEICQQCPLLPVCRHARAQL